MHSQYKWYFDKKSLLSQYFFIKLCTNLIDEDGCLAEYVEENVCVFLCVCVRVLVQHKQHQVQMLF